jgi:mannose-6-phosphate isomerase
MENSERPWGSYFILEESPLYKVKRIEVNPGKRLSYQYHNFRTESWTIIKGKGLITVEGNIKEVNGGQVFVIPQGAKHRIENNGDEKLIFIEVQTGTYFGEDDIVRIEDDFQRV